jgi:hypothetical protein
MDELGLFTAALGLSRPWRVVRTEFDPEAAQLDLYLEFDRGARFVCPAKDCAHGGCPDALGALELLARAPDPASAARLTIAQISTALTSARRRNIPEKAARIQALLRTEHLGQPEVLTTAYASTTRAAVAVLRTLNEQVTVLQGQVEAHFGPAPGR